VASKIEQYGEFLLKRLADDPAFRSDTEPGGTGDKETPPVDERVASDSGVQSSSQESASTVADSSRNTSKFVLNPDEFPILSEMVVMCGSENGVHEFVQSQLGVDLGQIIAVAEGAAKGMSEQHGSPSKGAEVS
jgi:hypothetical protein